MEIENNQIDFDSDINELSNKLQKSVKINNVNVVLNLQEYCDIKSCDVINNWKLCLGMLGKMHLFKRKNIMKVVYCLLTDSCVINNVNGNKIDIDVFDVILDKFLIVDVIDETERNIKLRVFTVCNTLIIIDCKDLNKYKIYKLHNVYLIKEYYGINKINFDTIANDIKLEPMFVGSIDELEDDYKKMSIINFKKDNGIIIDKLIRFLSYEMEIEKKIQKEYIRFYKLAIR